ncbi:MAG: HD domain-containing phosphohydrolase [Thermodesulfobacteriota bacterium]
MTDLKVLYVDDEIEMLKSLQRRLRDRFAMDVASSGEEGLELISTQGPYAVIVSDYSMPVMDGIEFLSRVKALDQETIRIMLTGYADIDTAIKAVNEGQVFRFLTKPCPTETIARAITEGLNYQQLIRAERELHGLKKWRHSLEKIIQAFIRLVEARDPYTSGHQEKVARLSQAIAERLGLESEQVEAIRMAANIHDLGKVYVPAEILNRPGRLSEVEFKLICLHPQVGHDILEPIDFEQPIAEIVLQHHERLDGSGYPAGLRGEEIRLEARIIAVADVVEAMSSHRPYRPSLGLDKALDEITARKGDLYDPRVVEACWGLFREKAFSFNP